MVRTLEVACLDSNPSSSTQVTMHPRAGQLTSLGLFPHLKERAQDNEVEFGHTVNFTCLLNWEDKKERKRKKPEGWRTETVPHQVWGQSGCWA